MELKKFDVEIMKLKYTALALVVIVGNFVEGTAQLKVQARDTYLEPSEIVVNGLLGDAITSDRKGRLAALPKWNNGELITMFGKDVRDGHNKMDWYGEHGGKWLYTASHAAKHSKDKELEALVLQTADYLVKQQSADGYLGNYGTEVRITNDAISHKRSWDVWNLSYMTLGMLQVNRFYPNPAYLNAAKQIGELFIHMYGTGEHNITDYGTRRGTSATIMLEPVVELYKVTKDERYLKLAELVIKEAEAKEDHRIITAGKNNLDMEFVGDGKIYQVIWNVLGIVKLYEVTGNPDYLKAAENIWQNISEFHLNITGGPWGGVGKHMECFNRKNYWSPYGMVETCSTMSWIQLNKEMLRMTGNVRYAQAIEKSAYNSLLGARFSNGVDWSYHSFNNGSWSVANFNDCCPSSGALALEELPSIIYSKREGGIAINLFTESEAIIPSGSKTIRIKQQTYYPFDGKVDLVVTPSKKDETFSLYIRIPDWANSTSISVNGKPADASSVKKGEYFVLNRSWRADDKVAINFPIDLRIEQRKESLDGPQNAHEIYHTNWFALTRGPLVFSASGLIDGRDRERVLEVDVQKATNLFSPVQLEGQPKIPAFQFKAPGIQPLLFVPYYQAGGVMKGNWRLTWLQSKIN